MSQTRLTTGNGPFLTEEGLQTNINQGGEAYQIWKGSSAEISAKRAQLIAQSATKLQLQSVGDGDYTVHASWPYDVDNPSQQTYVDTLELETNLVQRSVYQSALYRTRFSDYDSSSGYSLKANLTLPIIAKAKQLLDSLQPTIKKNDASEKQTLKVQDVGYSVKLIANPVVQTYDTAEAAAAAYLADRLSHLSMSGSELAGALQFYYEVAYMGVTSFWEFGTVFRRTVTASVPSAISANFSGSGMIWTSAEVSAFEGIPTSGGWFNLPAGKQWIKDKPRVSKSYGQKTQLMYSYTEIVSASALHYQAYGTATLIHT